MTTRLKANIKHYEFACGCITKELPAKKKKYRTGSMFFLCEKHKSKLTGVVIICHDCGKEFDSKTRAKVRCEACNYENKLKIERVRTKKRYRERKANGTLPKQNQKKKEIDMSRRWECVNGDKCLNASCYNGIDFNCKNCKRFKKVERFMDVYTIENQGYLYA